MCMDLCVHDIKTRCSICQNIKAMLRTTAVVAPKEKDDDRNIFPETGIYVKHHSPTKISFTNTHTTGNKFLSRCTTTLLIAICIVLLCLPQQCLAQFASSVPVERNKFDGIKQPPPTQECGNIAIRRNCRSFAQLKNCTHVLGHLYIALMNAYNLQCNATEHRYENLREITDFLLIADVDTLTSIKDMFPNLAVIRGRRLFVNYAVVLSSISDLEKVEFKSLVSIQRGHVIVENTPKLCYAEKINWERLTSKRGTNNIFLDDTNVCPKKAECKGCKTDYCWSNDVCQKFATDSVVSPIQDIAVCHEQCLGGCYNQTAQGCVVCKSYTDHGTCVKKCPDDKYNSSHFMRCFTREECIKMKLFVHKNECVDRCPTGYNENIVTGVCDSCVGNENCTKRCDSESIFDPNIYITDISQAEYLRGCEILNGSLVIDIYVFFDQRELKEHFQDLKEITGYLKIYRSPFLVTLDFFQSLEKIHGTVLENGLFSFVLYSNKNLTELWKTKPGFQIVNGGMYIHGNDKLCNRHIREFRQKAKHDKSLDSIQKSDKEVFCSPAKLNLYVEVLHHRSFTLYWPKDQTFPEVEIIYKALGNKEQLAEKSELDTEVCLRINWVRELMFAHELKKNSTHYMYTVKNLEPHTRYATLVKTFNGDDDTQEARSEMKYVTTKFDIPAAPKIFLKGKTLDTLSVEFSHNEENAANNFPVIDYYILEVYDMPDDKEALDTRDYCDEPIMDFKDNKNEDYDDCCSRRDKDKRDKHFLSKLRREFACSIDHAEYCKINKDEFSDSEKSEPILKHRFEAWENEYVITSLQHFHLYVLQLQACNHAGCSSYTMLPTRTNYSLSADNVDFSFCQVNNSNEYRISFSEPKLPNGYITSYALHFRNHSGSSNGSGDYSGLVCVTRLEHEQNEYVYVKQSNHTFNQAAVRVHSLGHHTFVEWKNVSTCSETKLIVLYYFLIALAGISLMFFAKWLFHYIPTHCGWRSMRPEPFAGEDRMTLMDGVNVIPFNRFSDLEMIELQDRNPEQ